LDKINPYPFLSVPRGAAAINRGKIGWWAIELLRLTFPKEDPAAQEAVVAEALATVRDATIKRLSRHPSTISCVMLIKCLRASLFMCLLWTPELVAWRLRAHACLIVV
jgi:hypothetical protein